MPTPIPVGIKNNNYLNVKNGASPWLDAGGRNSGTDGKGHAVFSDPAYGVRAGILLLKTYFFTHKRRTIAEILSRWAPASDTIGSLPGGPPNAPHEYSIFVGGRMGISYNRKLEIFQDDRSLGNLAQLRDLFFAMAAYEIGGGFKVSAKDFLAGLELLQPGIKLDGTDAQLTNVALAVRSLTAPAPGWKISASVGRWDKSAVNTKADVKTVQRMLRHVAMLLNQPAVDPAGIDGEIVQPPKKSPTVAAITAFQSRFLTRPDGLIEMEGRTWREMVRVLTTEDEGGSTAATGGRQFYFPFAALPTANWTSAPRSFAARRDGGARAHAGCDLYFPQGTVIHAIADGTVVRGPYPFYAGTSAIEIDHGDFLARYGEVQATAMVRTGDTVTAGQPIARVGHLLGIDVPSDMLHLELYDKSTHGPLTVSSSASARTATGIPFMRRRDLMDPTDKLNTWKANLPRVATALAKSFPDPDKGFTIRLDRIRQELRPSAGFTRTVGNYRCFWDGVEITGLSGQMVERGGPGNNTTEIGDYRDLRIRQGSYRLAIQEGSLYRTYGYTSGKDRPRPGLLLKDTDERFAILIHPGEDYVSSVGCLNPALNLTGPSSAIGFSDSRRQVIAIIDEMKSRLGPQFPNSGTIPDATIIISGEPS